MRRSKIHRIFVNTDINVGETFIADKNLTTRIHKVLRIKSNEKIILFNGNGKDYICAIDDREAERIQVEKSIKGLENDAVNTLGLSISSGKIMDYAIQKSVELGIKKILPIITERSHPTDINKRYLHWKKIILSACEQCGSSTIPEIEKAATLSEIAKYTESSSEIKICFDPRGEKFNMNEVNIKQYIFLIGSEGGFSDNDITMLKKYNWRIISLGDRILRTETACVVAQTLMRKW